ncbi:hypothetical protein [Bradyrhizobium elkanii]|uniref:hypothetical protein n=1 Tax=Bradyrhizobium elkanii TaxID=29448 RepID=UPI00272D8BF9|nr:hypothetical protein [Bradyrhizobium elkanii]WLA80328.1 hypothetical protein QNJ99_33825 [Bradyrhizobium elkanii]
MRAARWSDHDHYFGPFTFAWSDHYRTIAVCLRSSDDEDRLATFRVSIGRFSILSVVPGWLVRPERKRVKAKYWSEQDIERQGRDWYWDITPREYGFSINEGHLSIEYGRVTHDSSTEQRWGCFLPWTQWRFVRHSFYGLTGEHFWTIPKGMGWDERRKIEEQCPTASFDFADYDGEKLVATTKIEEREWKFGEGWFKWLSIFRRPMVRRSLDISFSGETGREKGSWKGGTTGTGIDMQPGELHESAFRRYCDEEHRSKSGKYQITFIGPVISEEKK